MNDEWQAETLGELKATVQIELEALKAFADKLERSIWALESKVDELRGDVRDLERGNGRGAL